MAGSDAKDRIIYPLEKRVVNPVVLLAWDLGLPPPGDALLETTGRRTGQLRRTPVCDGLDGDTFWLVAQRGHRADWVRNIAANPRVRVKFRSRSGAGWRAGTAHQGRSPRRGRERTRELVVTMQYSRPHLASTLAWLMVWVRSPAALRLATISARIASTAPSRPLGQAV
jgi:deazaflavin-dependent oxidoreductase (nitroreductase family)